MRKLGALLGASALGLVTQGCQEDPREKCDEFADDMVQYPVAYRLCDEVEDPNLHAECVDLAKRVREVRMSDCLSRETRKYMSCTLTDTEEEYACEEKTS